MVTIDVDFQVYKELTRRRKTESVSYNDVIRDALNLKPKRKDRVRSSMAEEGAGCFFKGVHFPEGTQLRATYKGQTHHAQIKDGRWTAEDGSVRKSPSDASNRITGKSWNGWRFWSAKRPEDTRWLTLLELRTLGGRQV